MTAPVDRVVVVIPAYDEVDTIATGVASVLEAARRVEPRVHVDVVVAVDRASGDGSAAVARWALRGRGHDVTSPGCVVEEAFGTVGRARRRATEVGLARADVPLERTWLATTDADTLVPPSWIERQLEIAADGAVGVAGIVELHEPPASLDLRFRHHYRTADDGSHGHVHGANLGVRADVLVAAGGWRDLATGEDHDLWHRVRACGPVVHTTAVRVATSPRRHGRAPEGFAADLAALEPTA